jgi:hypothetical protein
MENIFDGVRGRYLVVGLTVEQEEVNMKGYGGVKNSKECV